MVAGVGGEKVGFVAIPGEILKLDWLALGRSDFG